MSFFWANSLIATTVVCVFPSVFVAISSGMTFQLVCDYIIEIFDNV